MNNSRILVSANISKDQKNLIADYWEMESDEFKFNLAQLSVKYGFTTPAITKTIIDHSRFFISEICPQCGNRYERRVTSKGKFKFVHDILQCPPCKEAQLIHEENKRSQEIEEIKLRIKQKQKLKDDFLEKAIDGQEYQNLTELELETLKVISMCTNYHQIVYKLFKGKKDYKNNEIWSVIERLETIGLLFIEREWDQVKNILAPSNIKFYFNNMMGKNIDNELSFSLSKRLLRATPKHPHYSGTFTLQTDVILKAGVKYIYGGWEQTDQSINLKFTPADQIKKVHQTTEVEETPSIGELIFNMNNKIG